MCGRYALYTNIYNILSDLHIESNNSEFSIEPQYNITPSQKIIALFHNNRSRKPCVGVSTWGLIPNIMSKRYQRTGIRPSMFHNARLETITRKPSFSHAFSNSRCLIPADGFYEWDPYGNPHFFSSEDNKYILFASIYAITNAPHKRHQHKGNAIITTQARSPVATIHKRMPVMISSEHTREWLDILTPEKRLMELIEVSAKSIQLKQEQIDPVKRQKEALNAAGASKGIA